MLLIDEIDALVGDSLVSVLRQLRSGYARRPGAFPQSVVLCGVRDVRDYRIRAGHLVVFDMREGGTWAEKIYREERSRDGAAITVWGA